MTIVFAGLNYHIVTMYVHLITMDKKQNIYFLFCYDFICASVFASLLQFVMENYKFMSLLHFSMFNLTLEYFQPSTAEPLRGCCREIPTTGCNAEKQTVRFIVMLLQK